SAIYTPALHDALPICLLFRPGHRSPTTGRRLHRRGFLLKDAPSDAMGLLRFASGCQRAFGSPAAGAHLLDTAPYSTGTAERGSRSEEHTSELQSPDHL